MIFRVSPRTSLDLCRSTTDGCTAAWLGQHGECASVRSRTGLRCTQHGNPAPTNSHACKADYAAPAQDNTHLAAAGVLRQTARAIVATVNSAAPSPAGHTMRSNSDWDMRLRYITSCCQTPLADCLCRFNATFVLVCFMQPRMSLASHLCQRLFCSCWLYSTRHRSCDSTGEPPARACAGTCRQGEIHSKRRHAWKVPGRSTRDRLAHRPRRCSTAAWQAGRAEAATTWTSSSGAARHRHIDAVLACRCQTRQHCSAAPHVGG